ncbi:FtsQ-type POTRA domain-containing protein [Streptomyces sp. 8K308]|uniref:cell division protein FtsQ/DivIB n=1 Tax=Streptomyces sp. 8K308 TaxID=2530388 RepID=UPI00104C7A19|nr:FtsQ-type POTRA domain-containing protein [Streptomyces sp. 8K308]TDC24332.1 FtsQ-type POTRA domain-containing protein [Streptomyces sp. 8K308]
MAEATTAKRAADRQRSDPGPPSPRPPRRRRWLPGRRLTIVLLVLAAALGGFGGWALYGSSWLRIEHVSVRWRDEGPRNLTEDQVLEAAGVPLDSPMISLDKDAIRHRLLDRLPRLESVEVVRAWPHGVGLRVTERQAEVLIPVGDRYIEVDEGGVRFGEVAEPIAGVPLLELDLDEGPGLRRFGEDGIRREAVAVALSLPDVVREDLRVIRAASFDSVTLELTGDRTVFWGSSEDPEAKAEALAAVMEAAGDARHFDVSAPTVPAVSDD